MSKNKPQSPIIEPLRQAVKACGISRLQLSKEAGVVRQSIIRFERGDNVRSDVLEKLATYFGLELQPKSKDR
ncbi:MAG: helix-turn-helix transcriptional regulator [Planctomycetaceae bacterium]